jgi:hypothetical protein
MTMARTRGPGFSYLAGVRVSAASIWFDAARARAVCFLSSADAIPAKGRAVIGRLIASERCITLRRALGAAAAEMNAALVPRFGRPFALGRARLELVPGGGMPGVAQLLVEIGGWRGLYAGAPSRRVFGGAEPMQVRACDEIVVDAPEDGGVVDSPEDLRAALSGDRDLAPADLRAFYAIVDQVDPRRLALSAPLARVGAPGGATRRRTSSGALRVVSGRRSPEEADTLALGIGATVGELAELAAECGARRVHVRIHTRNARRLAGARVLAAALREGGVEVDALGPPEQLSLQLPG